MTILATSREGLRVPGEQLVTVPSLDEAASLELFARRATDADASLALGDDDRAAMVRVCDRLDGIPLAIELAAARVRMFTVDELDQRLSQRFRLLTGGRGVERHQTLRAAIDWSYDLLEPDGAGGVRLPVGLRGRMHPGGRRSRARRRGPPGGRRPRRHRRAPRQVDWSSPSARPLETRYRMMETIRQYAEERLVQSGVAEEVRGHHARWCAGFARAAGRGIYSSDEPVWLARLGAEVPNLRAGVTWAAGAGDVDTAMRIGASFVRQAVERPLLGTAFLAEQAMQTPGAETHVLRARALSEAAWGPISRGDTAGGAQMLRDAIEAQRAGARYAAASYTYQLSILSWSGDQDAAYATAAEGLARAEAADDVLGEIGSRIAFASTAAYMGELERRPGARRTGTPRRARAPATDADRRGPLRERRRASPHRARRGPDGSCTRRSS